MVEQRTPRLLVRQGATKPFEVRITRSPFRVGREPDNDLVISDTAVSGYHFQIRREGGVTYLDDLDSSNGTYLNQNPERITTVTLTDRSRIVIGRTLMSYREPDPGESRSAPPVRKSVVVDDLESLSKHMSEMVAALDDLGESSPAGGSQPTRFVSLSSAAQAGIEQVANAYARLTALYDATGHIIAGINNLEQCLNNVLDAALGVLQADRGFVMLCSEESDTLQVKAARALDVGTPEEQGSMGIAEQVASTGQAVVVQDAGTEFSGRESVILQNIRSVLCVPLQLDSDGTLRTIGVLYLDKRRETHAFGPEDEELLSAFGRLAAVALENARLFSRLQEEERLRERMGRSLPRAVVHKLMDAGEEWGLGGDEQFVTVLNCDIRGFTPISERLTPRETIDLLNYYFGEMTPVVFAHEGTLDKFMGDGLLAIFGAPYKREDDAARAAQCAIEMVGRMATVNAELERRGLPRLQIGIGLNSGVAIAGNVGSERRMDYTVVGDVVNVSDRLQKEARPDPDGDVAGMILLTESTYELVKDRVRAVHIGDRRFRGKGEAQPVYQVELPTGVDLGSTARQAMEERT